MRENDFFDSLVKSDELNRDKVQKLYEYVADGMGFDSVEDFRSFVDEENNRKKLGKLANWRVYFFIHF